MNPKFFDRTTEIAFGMFDPNHLVRTFHVSFAIYKNRIIAIDTNDPRTTPINLLNPRFGRHGLSEGKIIKDKGSCSELRTLLKVKNRTNTPFSKISLINIRIDRNQKITQSFPCQSCQSLIEFCELDEVWFTDSNGQFQQYR